MIFPSYDGSEIELTLTGHRWPKLEGGRQTLHWLKVSLQVLASYGSFQIYNVPCILDWEVEELICWLDAITHGETVPRTISFYEAMFSIELLTAQDQEVILRFGIHGDAKRWILDASVNRKDFLLEHSWHQEVDLFLSGNQLARSVYELRQAFEQLPVSLSQ